MLVNRFSAAPAFQNADLLKMGEDLMQRANYYYASARSKPRSMIAEKKL